MDPRPPQIPIKKDTDGLEKPKEKFKENQETIADIQQGKFHIAKFGGQTCLYIPQKWVDSLGKTAILQLTDLLYTPEVLKEFYMMQSDYEHCFMLELPPQRFKYIKNVGWVRDEEDQRVEQLIVAIESQSK